MANKSIVSNYKLDQLANEIAAKAGAPLPMTVDDMSMYVQSMPSGGGGDVTALIDGTIVELTNDDAYEVRDYFLRQNTNITSVSMSNVTRIGQEAFNACTALEYANFPSCTEIGDMAFYWCINLHDVEFPNLQYCGNNAFMTCRANLKRADLGVCESLGGSVFAGCTYLTTLILRNTDQVCSLPGTNVFDSTAIKNGYGYIYVPEILLQDYKQATNWTYIEDRIKPLTELPE